jgi:fumarylpyruvate hydrolase
MTQYAIPAWELPSIPVAGSSERFPVRHIYCVGRNYAEHAKEMGGDATKEPPFFFTKSADAIVPVVPPAVGKIPYPMATKNFHHELELVVAIGKSGVKVAPGQAQSLIYGYAVGLDMTRRDLQSAAKEKQRPWDIGKNVEQSAVLGEIGPASEIGHPAAGRIELRVNGETKQSGDLSALIHSVAAIIANLSQFYHLQPGDLIYTGTPAGVGPVKAGDRLEGSIAGVGTIAVQFGTPE